MTKEPGIPGITKGCMVHLVTSLLLLFLVISVVSGAVSSQIVPSKEEILALFPWGTISDDEFTVESVHNENSPSEYDSESFSIKKWGKEYLSGYPEDTQDAIIDMINGDISLTKNEKMAQYDIENPSGFIDSALRSYGTDQPFTKTKTPIQIGDLSAAVVFLVTPSIQDFGAEHSIQNVYLSYIKKPYEISIRLTGTSEAFLNVWSTRGSSPGSWIHSEPSPTMNSVPTLEKVLTIASLINLKIEGKPSSPVPEKGLTIENSSDLLAYIGLGGLNQSNPQQPEPVVSASPSASGADTTKTQSGQEKEDQTSESGQNTPTQQTSDQTGALEVTSPVTQPGAEQGTDSTPQKHYAGLSHPPLVSMLGAADSLQTWIKNNPIDPHLFEVTDGGTKIRLKGSPSDYSAGNGDYYLTLEDIKNSDVYAKMIPPEYYTQEAEPIQEEILALRDEASGKSLIADYMENPSKWRALTPGEQLSVFQKMAPIIASHLGVVPPKIIIDSSLNDNSAETNFDTNTIRINPIKYDYDFDTINGWLEQLGHEFMHIQQNNPDAITDMDRRTLIETNRNEYHEYQNNPVAYRAQFVERDAESFGKALSNIR